MLNQTQLTIGSNNITLNEGLYSLNDLHKASGGEKRHQPSNWLALVQTKELVDTLIEEQNCTPEIPGVGQINKINKLSRLSTAVTNVVHSYVKNWCTHTPCG